MLQSIIIFLLIKNSIIIFSIFQLSKNGHERLDVYLEPEDYYNLQSQYQQYQVIYGRSWDKINVEK